MRATMLAAAWLLAACGVASAQTATTQHHRTHAKSHAPAGGETPVDVGPYTPQANAAYQGGGVILQGAPGAPAPKPQATPPGQAPSGSVPP